MIVFVFTGFFYLCSHYRNYDSSDYGFGSGSHSPNSTTTSSSRRTGRSWSLPILERGDVWFVDSPVSSVGKESDAGKVVPLNDVPLDDSVPLESDDPLGVVPKGTLGAAAGASVPGTLEAGSLGAVPKKLKGVGVGWKKKNKVKALKKMWEN